MQERGWVAEKRGKEGGREVLGERDWRIRRKDQEAGREGAGGRMGVKGGCTTAKHPLQRTPCLLANDWVHHQQRHITCRLFPLEYQREWELTVPFLDKLFALNNAFYDMSECQRVSCPCCACACVESAGCVIARVTLGGPLREDKSQKMQCCAIL